MDESTLEKLKEEYPTSSWALWSHDFPKKGCKEEHAGEFYELIKENRDRLQPSIVLLSLNPSTELPENYLNFHSTDPKHRNDQFRDLVEDAGLEGGYMTDLVERIIEADSAQVEPGETDVENLLDQLDLLEQENYYLICFHSKVYQTLKNFFNATTREFPHDIKGFTSTQDGKRFECYRVWFHANWGVHRDKIPALRKQLNFLNSEIIHQDRNDLSRWID